MAPALLSRGCGLVALLLALALAASAPRSSTAAPPSRAAAAAIERREALQRDRAMKERGGLSEVAHWLLEGSEDLREAGATHRQVLDGLMLLAKAQQALKGVDGIQHELSSALGKSNARSFRDLLASVRSAPAAEVNLRRAARLRRNAALLRGAFEAAEVMDAMEQPGRAQRQRRLAQAGLRPLDVKGVEELSKVRLARHVASKVLEQLAQAYADEDGDGDGGEGEGAAAKDVVIAVGEACTGEALLQMLMADPVKLRARAPGAPRWSVIHVNPDLLLEALMVVRDAWRRIEPLFPAAPQGGGDAGADGAADTAAAEEGKDAAEEGADAAAADAEPLVRSIHCVGHSAGGAVAALVAALLGERIVLHVPATLPVLETLLRARLKAPRSQRGELARETARELLRPLEEYRERLGSRRPPPTRATTFGSPPAISATTGGRFGLDMVTSFVNGDDLVPRASPSSLYRFKKRLTKAMPKGEGILARGMAMTSWASFGLVKDAAGVTKQNLGEMATGGLRRTPLDDAKRGKRKAEKLEQELEAGDPTVVTMVVPGRIVFVKPRRAKNGATMSMLKAASVKRDLFWQMDDVLASKSMWRHHRLSSYIRTLDRV
mmetsp:Transcript_42439/g.133048  ORF Transcript_42439/g.133048 Transcript_42439/m.133048 type:complete len:607 (-) Transcript_42439:2204-4024(-)